MDHTFGQIRTPIGRCLLCPRPLPICGRSFARKFSFCLLDVRQKSSRKRPRGEHQIWKRAEVNRAEVAARIRAQKAVPRVSQSTYSSHPLRLISISYRFPLGCHGRIPCLWRIDPLNALVARTHQVCFDICSCTAQVAICSVPKLLPINYL